jgi:hypothetical protein
MNNDNFVAEGGTTKPFKFAKTWVVWLFLLSGA